ncbi:hypothetical protein [Thermocatellispora tengchongensis]|uniref:hypothetical protein n=1 Tax=Thermocatellispora tengchongensis TaxID=1073253 RepID=UPI00362B74E6
MRATGTAASGALMRAVASRTRCGSRIGTSDRARTASRPSTPAVGGQPKVSAAAPATPPAASTAPAPVTIWAAVVRASSRHTPYSRQTKTSTGSVAARSASDQAHRIMVTPVPSPTTVRCMARLRTCTTLPATTSATARAASTPSAAAYGRPRAGGKVSAAKVANTGTAARTNRSDHGLSAGALAGRAGLAGPPLTAAEPTETGSTAGATVPLRREASGIAPLRRRVSGMAAWRSAFLAAAFLRLLRGIRSASTRRISGRPLRQKAASAAMTNGTAGGPVQPDRPGPMSARAPPVAPCHGCSTQSNGRMTARTTSSRTHTPVPHSTRAAATDTPGRSGVGSFAHTASSAYATPVYARTVHSGGSSTATWVASAAPPATAPSAAAMCRLTRRWANAQAAPMSPVTSSTKEMRRLLPMSSGSPCSRT